MRSLGHELAKFPVEPSFAKSLLAASYVSKTCTQEMCKLLAILSTESIWMGVSKMDTERQRQFFNAKEEFRVRNSDHYSLVLIYNAWKHKLDQSHQTAQ